MDKLEKPFPLRGTNKAPESREDLERMIHNTNTDMLKCIKDVEDGYVIMTFSTEPFPRYLIRYSDNNDHDLIQGESMYTLDEFKDHMRTH